MPSLAEKELKNNLAVLDCGLASYRESLVLQHRLYEKRLADEISDTVLIVEHLPVITFGTRESHNRLLAEGEGLRQKGIELVQTRRGGGATAHNPGQLIFYPILNLRNLGLSVSEYVRRLEAIGIELLGGFGVQAGRREKLPGLWVDEKKIGSVGVRVSRSITSHGMALNICNDLSIFDFIVPCGLEGVQMTSVLNETGRKVATNLVKKKLSHLLRKYFTMDQKQNAAFLSTLKANNRKLPPWLRRPLPAGESYSRTNEAITSLGLQTICTNANCPNRGDCWERGTATILILGNICTRNCKFCSVSTGRPAPPEPTEPARVGQMVKRLGLKYLVITSVDRDDLPDGGAGHFRNCINAVRKLSSDVKFEILTPDFRDCQGEALKILADALPFTFAHNIETVPSLYPAVRAGGDYKRSLNLLKMAKETYCDVQTKSSIMLGLGETDKEVMQVLRDLRHVGCDRITIGQYLKPSKDSLEVVEYIRPGKFEFWKETALGLGFSWVLSAPFARSSYLAEQKSSPLV